MLLDAQILTVMVYLPTSIFVRIVHNDGQIDEDGCAINQKPVQWTSGTSVFRGPMDIGPTFTVPTLDGTFTFQNKWTGNDAYLFMFKYTDGSGNSNSGTWSTNPGTFYSKLPETHLFYGSFDSSYHNDVLSRKSDVEARLNPSEEEQWDGRIHYIDMDASNIQGGLGQMISSFNSPFFMGIDRFQRARIPAQSTHGSRSPNDPFHYTYEPHQWNAGSNPKFVCKTMESML